MTHRIRFVPFAAAATATVLLAAGAATAQTYPAKPVRLVVPFPPGGGVDTVGRIVGQRLAEGLGQPVVVDNRAGAAGVIGTDAVAKSAPDGYTLLVCSPGNTSIAPSLYPKLPYAPERDLAGISILVRIANILVVHPSVPARNVKELVALAKARPGKLNYASGGTGTSLHLSGEMLRQLAGIDIIHVPYKGTAPALADLLGGHVDFFFSDPSVMPQVKSGKLRALAVTTAGRYVAAPDLPTMVEAGIPGYEAVNWYGLLAPAGTPREIIARLHAETVKVLGLADVRERLLGQGMEPAPSTPAELAAYLREDTARWARVVKAGNIKIE
jgi:tripartite-type tricarboxylate transporter receptor subunit TctC